MKSHSAAVLTIRDAASMSKRGRHDIADWLRKQAAFLEKEADTFSTKFTARYLY